jgi:hypothetical protein
MEALQRWEKEHGFLGAELHEGIIIWHIGTDIFLAQSASKDEEEDGMKEVQVLSDYMACFQALLKISCTSGQREPWTPSGNTWRRPAQPPPDPAAVRISQPRYTRTRPPQAKRSTSVY